MRSRKFFVDYSRLYEIAKAKNEEKPLESDLYALKKFLDSNYEARLFLDDISVDKDLRKDFLKEVFKASSTIFWDLILSLIEKEETSLLHDISERYTRFVARKEEISFAELILARELPLETVDLIKKKFGDDISYKITIDPNIIGGFTIRKIDGTVFDASLSGRVKDLKMRMVL